jgi:opacity protein-like surface antigen
MRKTLVYFLVSIITLPSFSQVRLGIFGGLSNYQGDLTDKPYKSSKAAFGITASFPISQRFSIRTGLTLGKIAGADSLSDRPELIGRNLSFQSKLTEFSVVAVYDIFNIEDIRWTPYVFGGLAVFHFNPFTYDSNQTKVYLQPLSTEGQGLQGYPEKPYSLTQLSLPFGAGVKYAISDRVQIGLEIGLRKTFTDFLDDVSGGYADPADLLAGKGQQSVDLSYRGDELGNAAYPTKGFTRGNPKAKDYYYFSGLHLSFALGGGEGRSGGRGGYGCPKVF